MKANVKACAPFHIPCVDDILFLITMGPVLEKIVFCGNKLFLHCEVFLLTAVLTLVYSGILKIFYDQAIECFEGEFNL